MQACRFNVALARQALKLSFEFAEANGVGSSSSRQAAWNAVIAAGSALAQLNDTSVATSGAEDMAESLSTGAGSVEAPISSGILWPETAVAHAEPAPCQVGKDIAITPAVVGISSPVLTEDAVARPPLTAPAPIPPSAVKVALPDSLSETVTSAFVLDVVEAATAFYDVATSARAPASISIPVLEPEWRRLRSREPNWTPVEVSSIYACVEDLA